jgi:hypothetical protein
MTRHDDEVRLRRMLDHAQESLSMVNRETSVRFLSELPSPVNLQSCGYDVPWL